MDSKRDILHLSSWASVDWLLFKNKKKTSKSLKWFKDAALFPWWCCGMSFILKRKSILDPVNWGSGATVSQKQKEPKITSNWPA